MAKRDANASFQEQVVLELRPHWWFFIRQGAALVGAIAIGVAVLAFDLPQAVLIVAAVLILAALGWFLVRYIVWSTTKFTITTDRLIDRAGVFNRTGIDIPLERINTVHFNQSLFERMIGSGDLAIESAGETGLQRVNDIRKPLNVQNEIYRQIEDNENRKYDRIGGGGSGRSSAPAESSIPDQIEKLAELHRDGVLTDAEFESKKKELLDRL